MVEGLLGHRFFSRVHLLMNIIDDAHYLQALPIAPARGRQQLVVRVGEVPRRGHPASPHDAKLGQPFGLPAGLAYAGALVADVVQRPGGEAAPLEALSALDGALDALQARGRHLGGGGPAGRLLLLLGRLVGVYVVEAGRGVLLEQGQRGPGLVRGDPRVEGALQLRSSAGPRTPLAVRALRHHLGKDFLARVHRLVSESLLHLRKGHHAVAIGVHVREAEADLLAVRAHERPH
mmetsp:Transcript_142012/g.441574  ORF Transcript_142012/g.441574 Transcript_142012/m.441574 type:complete len:234 (+) Transcript_142012:1060-1761(+)